MDPDNINVVLIFALPPRYWKLEGNDQESCVTFWASDLGAELGELGIDNFDLVMDQYFAKDPIIEDPS